MDTMLRSDAILYVHLAAMMIRVSYSVFSTMDTMGGCKEEGDRQVDRKTFWRLKDIQLSPSLSIYNTTVNLVPYVYVL